MEISDIEKYIHVIKVDNKYDNICDEYYKIIYDEIPGNKIENKLRLDGSNAQTDFSKLEEDFINKIKELSDLTMEHTKFDGIYEKFTFSLEKELDFFSKEERKCTQHIKNCMERRLAPKINNVSNYLSFNCKYGKPTNMLLSRKTFKKYNDLEYMSGVLNMKIMFSDSVKDIYIWRKTDETQSGLVLYHTDNKYKFVTNGVFPERCFIKVVMDDEDIRTKKLKRIINGNK